MRLPTILSVLSFLIMSAASHADSVKIGYVDLQRAMMEVDEGAEATRKLKADFTKKQKILDQKKLDIQALQKELESQSLMMKAEIKQQKAQELQQKMMVVITFFMVKT